MRILSVWSGPRNISTACMYSWRQRSDTVVFDEPFYGVYLQQFDPGHPGRDEIITSMDVDVESICAHLASDGPRPIRYIKNIGHHLDALEPAILDRFENVLMIRDPAAMIASLTAKIGEAATVDVTGLPQQVRILERELAAGRAPTVIDSKDLLLDPPRFLDAFCSHLGVPFEDEMLTWPAGAKPEDGAWAKYWYESAHGSTGFVPLVDREASLSESQRQLLAECQPYVDRLREFQLRF